MRWRITGIAVAVTVLILVTVGLLVVSTQRELLLDDLADADATARRDVLEASTELAWLLLAALPVIVGGVAALVWWLVGRTLRPVEAIRAEVARLSADDLHRRVPVPGTGDEIDRLAVTMNRMLARLETARVRQDRFVADASHELRTPLARMIAELEVDEAHPWTSDPARARAAQLAHARSLADLVDALLTLARQDAFEDGTPSGAAAVDVDDVVLAEVAAAVVPPGVVLDASGVSGAQLRIPARVASIVVRNLLDNALRHAASRVDVSVADDSGEVRLTVCDDGPGIPEHLRTVIFDRFTRLDEARSADGGGRGLGLAIVADLVHRCGGRVSAQARPGGRSGACFVVVFARHDGRPS